MCPALNSQLSSPRDLHMHVAPSQRRVHGSSCKAAPAAVLLQLAAFGMVLKHQKIITPRKVQPQWPVLAAEPEEGLPVRGQQPPRLLLPQPMGTFTITYFLSSCLPQSENASEEAGEGEYVNLYSSGQSNGELPRSEGVSNPARAARRDGAAWCMLSSLRGCALGTGPFRAPRAPRPPAAPAPLPLVPLLARSRLQAWLAPGPRGEQGMLSGPP